MPNAFTQHAQGSFTTDVYGPFHCGPNHDTPKQFDFEVLVTYAPDALDSQGFLLDNQTFQGYFDSIKATDLSCEKLARSACEHFHSQAGERCHSVETSIWGIRGHARISYRIDRT